jgi:hypothetical protein
MSEALSDLLLMLRTGNAAVRAGAAQTLAGLTGTVDGLVMLATSTAIAAISSCVGAETAVGEPCVKALINLSAYSVSRDLVASRSSLAVALMESARDTSCIYSRACVALLANMSSSDIGVESILQEHDSCAGLQLRRLLPLLATKDSPALLGAVFANMSRHSVVRTLLLDPERMLLPVFFPLLAHSESLEKRRAAAATLRNCVFEHDTRTVDFLLSPSVDIILALVTPLARPARYDALENDGMPSILANANEEKQTEPDSAVRLLLVEALVIFAKGSRAARDMMRSKKIYYVIRGFHWWLEGISGEDEGEEEDAAGAVRGVMVQALEEGDDEGAGASKLSHDDEATVEAINSLVQQLWREDEVPMGMTEPKRSALGGSVVGGRAGRTPGDTLSGTATEDAARRTDELLRRTALARLAATPSSEKAASAAAAEAKMYKYATRSIEEARAIARRVATGEIHADYDDATL